MIEAWHFVKDTLRDGRPVPADGETLVHDGKLRLCLSGLHASEDILDALGYAPGHTICRVQCGGVVEGGGDKLVCSERTILWRVDGSELLLEFARWSALQVADLWDAPDVVLNYLKTGDESIRQAARDAALAASRGARAASRDAARTASRAAARADALVASRIASETASRAAVAAGLAASGSVSPVAGSVSGRAAAKVIAWNTAENAARNKQRDHLLKLIESQREKD